MKNLNSIVAALLILTSIGVSILFTITATQRDLNGLESTIWQIFTFAAGLSGSFIFGRQSAREAAREIIRPHARSAFRRVLFLYRSLSRASATIKLSQAPESEEDPQVTLAKLDTIVTEQLAAADDALEDWRDIVPEDVEGLTQNGGLITQGGIDNDETNSRQNRTRA